MARKKIEYDEISCDRCGKVWTTKDDRVEATLTRTYRVRGRDGGGDGRTDWDLCESCSAALDVFMLKDEATT